MADVENWLKNGRRWWRNECVSHHGRSVISFFLYIKPSYAEFF
jgi:hypothetical protein